MVRTKHAQNTWLSKQHRGRANLNKEVPKWGQKNDNIFYKNSAVKQESVMVQFWQDQRNILKIKLCLSE